MAMLRIPRKCFKLGAILVSEFSELTCLLSICLVLMCFVLVVSRALCGWGSKKSCLGVYSSRILYPEQAKMTGEISVTVVQV